MVIGWADRPGKKFRIRSLDNPDTRCLTQWLIRPSVPAGDCGKSQAVGFNTVWSLPAYSVLIEPSLSISPTFLRRFAI